VIGVSEEETLPSNRQNTVIRNVIIAVIIAGIAVGVVFLLVGAFAISPTTTPHG